MGFSHLDAEEIKIEKFFNEIDWNKLEKKEVSPPFQPIFKNDQDLSYFDKVLFYYKSLNFLEVYRRDFERYTKL